MEKRLQCTGRCSLKTFPPATWCSYKIIIDPAIPRIENIHFFVPEFYADGFFGEMQQAAISIFGKRHISSELSQYEIFVRFNNSIRITDAAKLNQPPSWLLTALP